MRQWSQPIGQVQCNPELRPRQTDRQTAQHTCTETGSLEIQLAKQMKTDRQTDRCHDKYTVDTCTCIYMGLHVQTERQTRKPVFSAMRSTLCFVFHLVVSFCCFSLRNSFSVDTSQRISCALWAMKLLEASRTSSPNTYQDLLIKVFLIN